MTEVFAPSFLVKLASDWREKHKAPPVPFGQRTRLAGVGKHGGCGKCAKCKSQRYPTGVGVHTHRASSKLYKDYESIPDSVVKFIESTG